MSLIVGVLSSAIWLFLLLLIARMIIGLIMSLVFLAAIQRFRPGAIDHHNVQLVLAVFITAIVIVLIVQLRASAKRKKLAN